MKAIPTYKMSENKQYNFLRQHVYGNKNLSMSAKAMYGLMLTYIGADTSCYPSLNTLQENLKCSRMTVVKAIKELELEDLIIKVKGNETTSNKYFLSDAKNKKSSRLKLVKGSTENVPPSTNNILGGSTENVPGVVQNMYSKDNIESINNNNKDLGSIKNVLPHENKKLPWVSVAGIVIENLPEYLHTRHTGWYEQKQKSQGKDIIKLALSEFINHHWESNYEDHLDLRRHLDNYIPTFIRKYNKENKGSRKPTQQNQYSDILKTTIHD